MCAPLKPQKNCAPVGEICAEPSNINVALHLAFAADRASALHLKTIINANQITTIVFV
jgi:hypothetical protein